MKRRCTAVFLEFSGYMIGRGLGGRNAVCISKQRDRVHCLSQLVILQTSRMGLRLVMLWGRIGECTLSFILFMKWRIMRSEPE